MNFRYTGASLIVLLIYLLPMFVTEENDDIYAIILSIFIFFILPYAVIFNSFISAKKNIEFSWSGIDVQLKRRYDLIPNLIKTVQAYAEHEKEVLAVVSKTRTEAIAMPKKEVQKQGEKEKKLTSSLKSLFALAEKYPDIAASKNFLKLQEEIEETEDQIAAARYIFNENVKHYNTKTESFPFSIIAKIHKFTTQEFFEFTDTPA